MQNTEPAAWLVWVRLGVVVVARAVLAMIAGLLVWAVAPAVVGWHPTTVMTGSMQPRLMVGDVAVSRPAHASDLHLNQVLLFDDPDHPGRLRLHRFIGVDDHGLLVTRGDANPAADSSHIRPAAVHGIGTLRVPEIGRPRVWLQDGDWLKLVLLAAGLGLTVAVALSPPLGGDPASGASSRRPHEQRRRPRPRTARRHRIAIAAVASGCVAVGLVIAVGTRTSWAAYTSSATGSAQWSAAPTYQQTSLASSTLTVNNTADPSGWYVQSSVSVTVTATASTGSVKSVSYQLGSGPVVTTNGSSVTFSITTQGSTTVSYWATDSNGLPETTHTAQIRLDQTKPNLTISSPGTSTLTHLAWAGSCSADFTGGGICGQTDDGNGIGVASLTYTLTNGIGKYWNGNTFSGATKTVTATVSSSGHWSSPIPDSALTKASDNYTLTITSTDQLGNALISTITFKVN